MTKLAGKDLSSLYPTPKTFDEQRAERKRVEVALRPRHVPVKIAWWTTLGLAIAAAAYWLGAKIVSNNLSSSGEVLFSVSSAIFLGLVVLAVAIYLYGSVNKSIARLPISSTLLFTILGIIIGVTGSLLISLVQQGYAGMVSIALVLGGHFVVSFLAVYSTVKRHG